MDHVLIAISFCSGLDLSRYVPSTMFPPDQPPEKSAFNYDLYAVSVSNFLLA